MTSMADKAAVLADYAGQLDDFVIVTEIDGNYGHMGAVIVDAILQAGVSYDSVVRPRVRRLLQEHPTCTTTTAFLKLLEEVGAGPLLTWQHDEKINRVFGATRFFKAEGVETEDDLKSWLDQPANMARLKHLRGVGDKTADYFKLLVGFKTNAVDRHLAAFASGAGILSSGYAETSATINAAADMLGVDRAIFDHSIWKYMSTRRDRRTTCH